MKKTKNVFESGSIGKIPMVGKDPLYFKSSKNANPFSKPSGKKKKLEGFWNKIV